MSDDPQFSVFTAFGAVAMLVVRRLPGKPAGRLTAYVMLFVIGSG